MALKKLLEDAVRIPSGAFQFPRNQPAHVNANAQGGRGRSVRMKGHALKSMTFVPWLRLLQPILGPVCSGVLP